MRVRQRRKDILHRGTVPAKVALRAALLPEGLSEQAHREEVRQIVRQEMVPPAPDLWTGCGFRLHDERVWDVIREVMCEN